MAIWSRTLESMVINSDFWRGRRVFLTGHTGFKGSWMSLWLQSMGAQVTGFSLEPATKPNLFEEAKVALGMNSVIGDIRDLESLKKAIQHADPEIIFHMAAQPLVRYSYQNPVETYSTNVMGTVHLLEVARSLQNLKAIVNITTDKCYENKEWLWGYRENDPMGGYDPYSNSKGCAELVTAAYRSSFFNPDSYSEHGVALASVRAGNVIGGGDWSTDRLIPDILLAFSQAKPVNIRNPHAVRPWQHVLEPLRGYLALAEKLHVEGASFAQAWNFGPNEEDAKPVGWIVDKMIELWGGNVKSQIDIGQHVHEANYLKLDISKARHFLNWHPSLNLNHALALTVEWAKRFQSGANMHEVTLSQIKSYHSSLNN